MILDNIRSRENVGSIFRTADGVGVSKIFLCGITPTPKMNNELRITNYESDKISKTALGAEKFVPWEYRRNTWRLVTDLKNSGVLILGLEQAKGSENIFLLKPSKLKPNKLALIVGNEVRGLSPKILKYCDKVVYIPMSGRKESLNVSVAAGIALYNLLDL